MENAREILQNKKNSIEKLEAKDLKAIEISKADINKNVEMKATLLMETLKAEPQWLRFFCKCFYKLPEGTIAFILEGAKQADEPCNYFCASASRELKKL